MTTPIEAGAKAIFESDKKALPPEVRQHYADWADHVDAGADEGFQEQAKAVFDSINVDELARILHRWDVQGGLHDGEPFDELYSYQKELWYSAARMVKSWLTGKESV